MYFLDCILVLFGSSHFISFQYFSKRRILVLFESHFSTFGSHSGTFLNADRNFLMKFSGSRIALLLYHCGQNFQYCVVSYSWLEYIHKICPSSLNGLNASINFKREHPRQTPGEFFEVVKSPAPGQNFSAKAPPPGQKTPTPGSILEDLVSLSY